MSDAKNKGGRPPRAPGEKMTRLSVMLRPIYREALDLLAREQRTSISQALENVLAQSLRLKTIGGQPLLEVAQGLVLNTSDPITGRLYRVLNTPLRTPEEQHAYDVLDGIRSLQAQENQSTALYRLIVVLNDQKNLKILSGDNEMGDLIALLFTMIEDTYKMGSPPHFCIEMLRTALDSWHEGSNRFVYDDPFGLSYSYDLSEYLHAYD